MQAVITNNLRIRSGVVSTSAHSRIYSNLPKVVDRLWSNSANILLSCSILAIIRSISVPLLAHDWPPMLLVIGITDTLVPILLR